MRRWTGPGILSAILNAFGAGVRVGEARKAYAIVSGIGLTIAGLGLFFAVQSGNAERAADHASTFVFDELPAFFGWFVDLVGMILFWATVAGVTILLAVVRRGGKKFW